jgi:hypothetical protein
MKGYGARADSTPTPFSDGRVVAVAVDDEPSGFRVTTVPFDSWETAPEWW